MTPLPLPALLLSRGFALAVLAFAVWSALRFPVYREALTVGLSLYAVVLLVEVRTWMVVLPAALVALSLGYWSGRYFWDELDLVLLVTIAGGLWHRVRWWSGGGKSVYLLPLLLFVGAQSLFTINGLLPLEAPVAGSWENYYASPNALREFKGVLWTLLLLPMLLQAQQIGGHTARWYVAGMAVGMLTLVALVVWERNLYTGIWNFGNAYRVSGWFFDLHTGGAAIDIALALMLPFVLGIAIWWRGWGGHGAMLAVLPFGLYGLFVTFSRANYPAVAAILLVFVVGLISLPGRRTNGLRGAGLKVAVATAVLLVVMPLVVGGTILERFKTTSDDLRTRLDHWEKSIELVHTPREQLMGIGKGSFVRRYHIASVLDGMPLSTLFRHRDDDGTAFVRFSPSDNQGLLDLRQRFRPPQGKVRVQLLVRTEPGKQVRLLIEFCERHILRFRSECAWVGTDIPDTKGQWRKFNRSVSLGSLGRGAWFERSPVDISIMNRGLKHELDVGAVRLIDAEGNVLLQNHDFAKGMDHWFMVDGNHLRWHVKNLFVYAYVEGGWLGLGALLLVVLAAYLRCWRVHRLGDPMGVIFAAAIAAGLAIGLFDSVLDAPRVTVMFLLPLLASLVWVPQPVALIERMPAYPQWMPRPMYLAAGLVPVFFALLTYKLVFSNGLGFSRAVVHYGGKLGLDHRMLVGLVDRSDHATLSGYDLVPAAHRPHVWHGLGGGSRPGGCKTREMRRGAVCWALGRNEAAGLAALEGLQKMWDIKPLSYGEYGNGWLLATLYDLLSDHPAMTAALRQSFQGRLQQVLSQYLLLLESNDPSVWAGRSTLAAQAMIIAASLEGTDGFTARQLRQAHYHYLEALEALAVAEAWPEGYNYWANSRGFLTALAGHAYVRAFPDAKGVDTTKQVFSRVGLWHLHNTRPDFKATQIGDEGPRIDLAEETQRIVDTLALVTGDAWLSAYSARLGKKFGARGYYQSYRWLIPLLRRHGATAPTERTARPDLSRAAWFGRNAGNMIYMRSDWGEDATMLSLRAGHNMSHHGHYDAGHFTLFKGAPLAVTGAAPNGVLTTDHRLNYGVRTVSKNSLLVLRPGEQTRSGGKFGENVADGGQRLTMPISNPLGTLDDWRDNLDAGLHLAGGEIHAYAHEAGQFTFVDADITRAYNTPHHDEGGAGGKVSRVRRQLVYLRRLDRVLLRDRIDVTDPSFKAKWLLQMPRRPQIDQPIVLAGKADNGLILSDQREFRLANGKGRLHVLPLLPARLEVTLLGGRDYRFFTDIDGDASTFDGRNMVEGSRDVAWFDAARWRLELSDKEPRVDQGFLTLLSPSIDEFNPPDAALMPRLAEGVLAVRVDDELVLFVETEALGRLLLREVPGVRLVRLFGLPSDGPIVVNGGERWLEAGAGLTLLASEGPFELTWDADRRLGNPSASR